MKFVAASAGIHGTKQNPILHKWSGPVPLWRKIKVLVKGWPVVEKGHRRRMNTPLITSFFSNSVAVLGNPSRDLLPRGIGP